ncbi:TetR/AcrR family transcriptional regulator [Streptomyces violaceusniger]
MGRPRTFDEERVVDAARLKFWETGFEGTSLDDLLRASGMQRSSFYRTFGDKRGLFLRALAAHGRELVGAVGEQLDPADGSPLERLRELVLEVALSRGVDAAAPQACLLAKASSESSQRDTDVAKILRSIYGDLEARIAEGVRCAQRAGEISVESDPQALATQLLVVMRGIEALREPGIERGKLVETATRMLDALVPMAR